MYGMNSFYVCKYVNLISFQKTFLKSIALIAVILLTHFCSIGQTCDPPTAITGIQAIPLNCSVSTTGIIQSGDVFQINFQHGNTYTIEVCYNANYSDPGSMFPMIELWEDLNGDLISGDIGNINDCASITVDACTDDDNIVYLAAYTHTCIRDWKEWDVIISCESNPLICNDAVQITLGQSGVQTIELDMLLENYSTNCSDEFEISIQGGGNQVDCSMIGQVVDYTVIHTASGLTCGGNIIVEDKAPPFIICGDFSINCGEDASVEAIGTPTVTDNCDENPSLTSVDNYVDYECMNSLLIGTINRIWTATDSNGNTASCTQVIDILRPNITDVTFPVDTMINCTNPDVNPESAGAPSIMDIALGSDCTILYYFEDDTTYNCQGNFKILRSWTVYDWCSNVDSMNQQLIEVIDTTGPVLFCPADFTVGTNTDACAADLILPMATATDACSDNVNISVRWAYGTTISSYENIPLGQHTIEYVATDDCGNSSVCNVELTIVDDTAPIAVCDLQTEISVADSGFSAICADDIDSGSYDNCQLESMEISIMGSGVFSECINFDCTNAGDTIMVILQVTDTTGLTNQCMVEVLVVDKISPLIGCPDDVTIQCTDDPSDLNLTGEAVVIETCLDTLFYSDEAAINVCKTGTIIRTWTAIDESGNSVSCDQLITIIDTVPPMIVFARDTSLFCVSLNDSLGMPIIVDDCSIFYSNYDDQFLVDEPCFQKVQRTWTVEDACTGETSSQTMLILMDNDNDPPAISGIPENITIDCAETVPDLMPIITDICDGDLDVEMIELGDTSFISCEENPSIVRIWTATDYCGNVNSFTQTIFILDTIAPIFGNLPLDITFDCSDNIPDFGITVTDNCDTEIDIIEEESIVDGACPNERVITRTYSAQDDCDNMVVHVQTITITDDIGPAIVSAPDNLLIVNCTDTIPFEEPVFLDNCSDLVVVVLEADTIQGDCTQESMLTRTWVATDECGNQTTVVQVINVDDSTGPTINNPPRDTTISCEQFLPFVVLDIRDDCGTDFSLTEARDTIGDACNLTITRTWTATDNCGNESTVQQIVSKVDTLAPVFTALPINQDVTIFLGCDRDFDMVEAIAEDDCDNTADIITSINYYSNGDVYNTDDIRNDTIFMGGDASGNYPLGMHTITFTSTDSCGNQVVAQRIIRLSENRPPSIGCDNIEVDINSEGIAFATTDQLIDIDETQDFCTDVTYSFATAAGDVGIDTIFYDCLQLGLNMYTIFVRDAFGNRIICNTSLNVSDPENICSESPSNPVILGKVFSENKEPIEDLPIYMDQEQSTANMTDEYGNYYFEDIKQGNNYQIAPDATVDPLNGVTTFDLVLIQKHILGLTQLDSPYKMIAADVNNSGTVTTSDIIELRQLILYIITDFENGKGWEYIDADFEFKDDRNPFLDDFSNPFSFENIQESQLNKDFIAIKKGDVNDSAILNYNQNPQNRLADFFEINTIDTKVKKDKIYDIEFTAEDLNELDALEFTLAFDSEKMEFISVNNEAHIRSSNIGIRYAAEGYLTVSWDKMMYEENSDLPLLSLQFKANKNTRLRNSLDISEVYTKANAYNDSGQAKYVQLDFQSGILDFKEAPKKQITLLQNQPNPFEEATIIGYDLPAEDEQLVFKIFDITGRLIYQNNYPSIKGYNQIEINHSIHMNPGAYYYQIQSEFGTLSKSMMRL